MTESTPLPTDGLVRLLGHSRRRELLRYLRQHRDDAVGLDALTDAVWQRCRDDSGPETRTATRIQLHHVDLPKLDDAGVLAYDQSAGSVVYEGDEDVDALLDTLATRGD